VITPTLTDLVANPHHVRSNGLLDAGYGSFDFRLLRYGRRLGFSAIWRRSD
jgi:hypothetical protein